MLLIKTLEGHPVLKPSTATRVFAAPIMTLSTVKGRVKVVETVDCILIRAAPVLVEPERVTLLSAVKGHPQIKSSPFREIN